MFLKFLLGAQRVPIEATTKTFPNMQKNPDFENEAVVLDLVEPKECMLDGELPITVQVFHKKTLRSRIDG